MFPKELTPEQKRKFWSLVVKLGMPGECWIWSGPKMRNGYGSCGFYKKYRAAHRVAYELLVGPIPAGLDLDHLCKMRLCVNPNHLEPVTRAENLRRSDLTGPGRNFRKTHCIRGHNLDLAYVYIDRKGVRHRYCLTCKMAGQRLRRGKAA